MKPGIELDISAAQLRATLRPAVAGCHRRPLSVET